ncbi:hypothetical protein PC110_g14917 [Phytophthora cactorum]|uniref:Uncharacterized protein n=1 Tax=Phytophthora cactorum TaxID=29920 RepID=A0A329RVS6_9STRA|nr:hypothetical protein PC110_g14917 [Phytophthora cactorum]
MLTVFMEGLCTSAARTEVFCVHPTSFEEAHRLIEQPGTDDLSYAEEADLLAAEQRAGMLDIGMSELVRLPLSLSEALRAYVERHIIHRAVQVWSVSPDEVKRGVARNPLSGTDLVNDIPL